MFKKRQNICDCAKYDRTTFYRYYNDITDILNKLEDEIIISIANSISKNINDKNSNKINYDGFNIFNNKYGEYITFFYKALFNLLTDDVINQLFCS